MKKNLNKDLIEGIILILISSFFISESLKLRGMEEVSLSPSLFPLIITGFLLIFSIILTIRAIRVKDIYEDLNISTKKMDREANNIRPVLLVIVASFIYLLILSRVHFIISSILYLLSLLLILGEKRWKVFLPIAIITPVLIFFIFTNLLDVLLP